MYSVSGMPHAQFGGGPGGQNQPNSVVGGSSDIQSLANAYAVKYNQQVNQNSPLSIDIGLSIQGNTLTATADLILESFLQNTSGTRVIFIISYNRDIEQPGDYFASVVRYHDQVYNPGVTRYTQDIALDPVWDFNKAKVVVILQNMTGDRLIYNARQRKLEDDKMPPVNLRKFSNNERIIMTWGRPNTTIEIAGYNIYKNGSKLNSEPLKVTEYTDHDIEFDRTYQYAVTALYGNEESSQSVSTPVTITQGIVQLGGGLYVNGESSAGPINITNRSLRG